MFCKRDFQGLEFYTVRVKVKDGVDVKHHVGVGRECHRPQTRPVKLFLILNHHPFILPRWRTDQRWPNLFYHAHIGGLKPHFGMQGYLPTTVFIQGLWALGKRLKVSHFYNLLYTLEQDSEITSGKQKRLSSNCLGSGKTSVQPSREVEDREPFSEGSLGAAAG